MNLFLLHTATFAAGIFISVLYFGSLWFVAKRVPSAPNPALLLLASYLIRNGLCVSAFYVVMGRQWTRLAACLLGFYITRKFVVNRLVTPQPEIQ